MIDGTTHSEHCCKVRETLNTRAVEYRDTRCLPDPYCYEVQAAWLAGYRTCLRDIKEEHSTPDDGKVNAG